MQTLAMETLLSALQASDPAERANAATQLGLHQATDALDLLIDTLEDAEPSVQQAASQALGQLSPLALQQVIDKPATTGVYKMALSAIAKRMNTGQGSVSAALLAAGFQVGPDAISPLISVMHANSLPASKLALTLLAKSKDERAVRPLLVALQSGNASMRCEAARGLGELAFPHATLPLIEALDDVDLEVQAEAAKALGRINQPAALPILLDVMANHHDAKVRRWAGNAIVKFGDIAIPLLRAALPRFDVAVRLQLVEMLTTINTANAVQFQYDLLSDPVEEVRYDVVRTWYFNRSTPLPGSIDHLLDDPSPKVRVQTLDTLVWRNVWPAVHLALHNDAEEVREKAATALMYANTAEATTALLSALDEPVSSVRVQIAAALAAQTDPRSIAAAVPLIEAIDAWRAKCGTDRSLIESGLKSLGKLRERSDLVLPYMRSGLKDPDPVFRREMIELMASWEDRRFVPELMSAMSDPDHSVAAAAQEALQELKGMATHMRMLRKLSRIASMKTDSAHYVPPPPPPSADQVSFSLVAPSLLAPRQAVTLTVWAHLPEETDKALQLAKQSYDHNRLSIHTKAGTEIAVGAELTVRLSIPGLELIDPEDSFVWRGSIANATFPVTVPATANPGSYPGLVSIHVQGIRVAKMHFVLEVGPVVQALAAVPAPTVAIPLEAERHRTAFASYASVDRNDVLSRIQGMQKVLPTLDVFVDIASLRSGQKWADRLVEEIRERDVFYLFWSQGARDSEWVEKEWRMALAMRGIDYIDPVPLVAPQIVPPPQELAGELHFNDWVLAFLRGNG